MSIEDQLRDSLHRRAVSVQPQPDLDDVVARTASRGRRTRRFLTVGLGVALLAGPLAGFAFGRARDDGRADVATGGGAASREFASGAGDAAMSSQVFLGEQPLEKLFLRTTTDGVAIRAYRTPGASEARPPLQCPSGGDCIALCATGPMITGELSTDAAVTVASLFAGSASGTAFGNVTSGSFGVAEGAPAQWVLVFVGDGVARVRATFSSGSTDEMEPVDGVALLASQVNDAKAGGAAVEALTVDGSVAGHLDIGPSDLMLGGQAQTSIPGGSSSGSAGSAESSVRLHSESSANGSGSSANASSSVSSSASDGTDVATSCVAPAVPPPWIVTPPPSLTLPSPGEQPADPAAARAGVEEAIATLYDGTKAPEERQSVLAAGNGLAELYAKVAAANGAGVTAASARATDVVFTNATEATVRYDILTSGALQFPGRLGTAVLVDGRWRITRTTACTDLLLAGVTCPSK